MVQPHLCLAHAPVELVHGQQAVHVVGELVQHSSHRIRVIAGLRLLKHALRGSVVGRPDVAEQRAAVRRRACRWQQAGMQAVKSHAGSKPQLRWQVACALLGGLPHRTTSHQALPAAPFAHAHARAGRGTPSIAATVGTNCRRYLMAACLHAKLLNATSLPLHASHWTHRPGSC